MTFTIISKSKVMSETLMSTIVWEFEICVPIWANCTYECLSLPILCTNLYKLNELNNVRANLWRPTLLQRWRTCNSTFFTLKKGKRTLYERNHFIIIIIITIIEIEHKLSHHQSVMMMFHMNGSMNTLRMMYPIRRTLEWTWSTGGSTFVVINIFSLRWAIHSVRQVVY